MTGIINKLKGLFIEDHEDTRTINDHYTQGLLMDYEVLEVKKLEPKVEYKIIQKKFMIYVGYKGVVYNGMELLMWCKERSNNVKLYDKKSTVMYGLVAQGVFKDVPHYIRTHKVHKVVVTERRSIFIYVDIYIHK